MIKDLFSHKIHSSTDDWAYKLVDIASVFSQFDGRPYDREAIEESFKRISPRASEVARDPSKYRDEISAYPAYLGLYKMQFENDRWVLRLSETAKRFLIGEEPNVPAFMILQLSLFQFPNGNGATYNNVRGNVSVKPNAANRTLEFIKDGIHLCPFRLICRTLLADSEINGISSLHPRVSVDEISVLTNDNRINKTNTPSIAQIIEVLTEYREGNLHKIEGFERRFHILNHTDLIQVTNGWIHLRETHSPEDQERLVTQLKTICNIQLQYNGFDHAQTKNDLEAVVANESWGNYFDGIVNLTAETVEALTNENVLSVQNPPSLLLQDGDELIPDNSAIRFNYPLKERDDFISSNNNIQRRTQIADPEVTRIKRQRSNLQHKILISKMDEHLRRLGATPFENEHIDLYAKIPNDGSFLFEVKSVGSENLLSQTRKGLSQLYEYRFRYKSVVGEDVKLCLVYPSEPNEIEWLQDYLCNDRNIAVCWFNDGELCFPAFCQEQISTLIANRN